VSRDPARATRIVLVSTAATDAPGSMRAYAETLLTNLAEHAPRFALECVELAPRAPAGRWRSRWQTAWLPMRARRLRGHAPDVWHVLDGSRAYVAPALGPAPVVITAHDAIPWLQGQGRFPGVAAPGAAALGLWRRNGEAMRGAARVVCDSARTAGDIQSSFSVAAARCALVPLPLAPAMARYSAEPVSAEREPGMVMHVGNNAFYKNRAGVLRVFARQAPTLAQRLWMLGPAPDPGLRALAAELGIAERVDWLSDPDDAVLADRYRRASVLLFPSLYEGFGWPVLEAMAFGLPVVCTDGGSLPEVAGEAARVCAVGDEAGLAEAVAELLGSPEAAAAAGTRGRERARRFSAAEFARAMAEVYTMAMANGRQERT